MGIKLDSKSHNHISIDYNKRTVLSKLPGALINRDRRSVWAASIKHKMYFFYYL